MEKKKKGIGRLVKRKDWKNGKKERNGFSFIFYPLFHYSILPVFQLSEQIGLAE
jgi:hypothetical protein